MNNHSTSRVNKYSNVLREGTHDEIIDAIQRVSHHKINFENDKQKLSPGIIELLDEYNQLSQLFRSKKHSIELYLSQLYEKIHNALDEQEKSHDSTFLFDTDALKLMALLVDKIVHLHLSHYLVDTQSMSEAEIIVYKCEKGLELKESFEKQKLEYHSQLAQWVNLTRITRQLSAYFSQVQRQRPSTSKDQNNNDDDDNDTATQLDQSGELEKTTIISVRIPLDLMPKKLHERDDAEPELNAERQKRAKAPDPVPPAQSIDDIIAQFKQLQSKKTTLTQAIETQISELNTNTIQQQSQIEHMQTELERLRVEANAVKTAAQQKRVGFFSEQHVAVKTATLQTAEQENARLTAELQSAKTEHANIKAQLKQRFVHSQQTLVTQQALSQLHETITAHIQDIEITNRVSKTTIDSNCIPKVINRRNITNISEEYRRAKNRRDQLQREIDASAKEIEATRARLKETQDAIEQSIAVQTLSLLKPQH